MIEKQEKPHNGDWMLKAIAEVYTKYNITDAEDVLVSTWGTNEADAKQQIIETATPERAVELLKASAELKAIIDKFIDNMKNQIASLAVDQEQHSILRHDYLTDIIQQVSNKDFYTLDKVTKEKKPNGKIYKNGYEMKIKDLEKISIGYGVSTKKLWTYISWLVTNSHDGDTTFVLPWVKYAEKNQIDINDKAALIKFKDRMYNDLCNLYETSVSINDMDTRVISSKTTKGAETDCFVIDMPERIVKLLKSSAALYLDNTVYQLSNKSPNAFSLAFKLSIQYYNAGNIQNKSNDVISVEKLLQYAPEIKSIEEFKESKRRTWKHDLKEPLEKALNDILDVGFLKSWHYRTGKSKKHIPTSEVEKMSLSEFEQLMIVFTPKNISKEAIEKLKEK